MSEKCESSTDYCSILSCSLVGCVKRQMDEIICFVLIVEPYESYAKTNASKDHYVKPGKWGVSIKPLNIIMKQEIHMQPDYLNLCTNYKQCLHA